MSAPLMGLYPQGYGDETVFIDGRRSDPADLREAVAEAARLGSELVVEPVAWGVFEPERGRFDWRQQEWWEEATSALAQPPERTYSIWVTHMWRRGILPADLRDEPFDSPRFIDRFTEFVAAVAERCRWRETKPVVLVANEIDLFTDAHPEEQEALVRFLPRAARAIHQAAPGVRVTNTVTHGLLQKPGGRELALRVHEECDIFGFNWYDITSWFPTRVESRTPAAELLDRMAALAGGRPLFLQETGLPSSPLNASSEEVQAALVDELFDALEERTSEQVWGCLWFELTDMSRKLVVDRWLRPEQPVLVDQEEFVAFLCSLGLRTVEGRRRPAYDRFEARMAKRLARVP